MTSLVRIAIRRALPPDVEHFSDYADYRACGYLDSLAFVSFVLRLEASLGVSLSVEELESKEFRTLEGIANLLKRKIA